MITASDELAHVVESLNEAEAERALELLDRDLPELFGDVKRYPVVRGDGKVVRVTVPS
jgi:hypothetical protein